MTPYDPLGSPYTSQTSCTSQTSYERPPMIPLGPNTLVAKPHIRREWPGMAENVREWPGMGGISPGYHRNMAGAGNGQGQDMAGNGRKCPEMARNGWKR